MTAEE